MSNSTDSIRSLTSDIITASIILLVMDKYMLVLLYITGIVGSVLNMITFLHKQIRVNPCSTYFLSTSTIDFCIMHTVILIQIIPALNPSVSNAFLTSGPWCKWGNYLTFLLTCLSSTYITLASIDRFCASSLNYKVRKLSNLKVGRILVVVVFLIVSLFALHIPISCNTSSSGTQCVVEVEASLSFLVIVDGYLFSLFNGAIVPLFLCIFGLLIYRNVRLSQRRVGLQQNARNQTRTFLNRCNQHMISMLLVQVLLTVILNIPYVVIYLLGFYETLPRNPLSIFLYLIFSFIGRWFYYMNYCKTFYLNTLTSKLFRDNLKHQLIRLVRRHRGRILP